MKKDRTTLDSKSYWNTMLDNMKFKSLDLEDDSSDLQEQQDDGFGTAVGMTAALGLFLGGAKIHQNMQKKKAAKAAAAKAAAAKAAAAKKMMLLIEDEDELNLFW